MSTFLQRRRARKDAREVLRQARHLRNTREDIMSERELAKLEAAILDLNACIRLGGNELPETTKRVGELATALTPREWKSSFRENVDVLIVAVAIAMAFRAYCFQPFKIPTGSMQPTLNGITSTQISDPTIWDRLPCSMLQFAWSATYYKSYHASATGTVGQYGPCKNPSKYEVRIGGKLHRVPKDAEQRGEVPRSGTTVHKGDVLWAGRVHLGDHLFVDKLAWNFRRPRRGEIMVFETDGIKSLAPHTHYIKRMCGVPGDTLQIQHPELLVNGQLASERTIARVAAASDGYSGYWGLGVRRVVRGADGRQQLMPPSQQEMWPPTGFDLELAMMQHPAFSAGIQGYREHGTTAVLDEGQYAAFGDNTTSSYDSRYWGPVSVSNLVGPAAFVYWPFGKHWGLSR